MENCIFCKIVHKESASNTIFENEFCIVFTPTNRLTEEHLLVVPKKHDKDIFEIDQATLVELIKVTKTMVDEIVRRGHATGINILHASGKDAHQSVFHFHLHIVPRNPDDGLDILTDVFSI